MKKVNGQKYIPTPKQIERECAKILRERQANPQEKRGAYCSAVPTPYIPKVHRLIFHGYHK